MVYRNVLLCGRLTWQRNSSGPQLITVSFPLLAFHLHKSSLASAILSFWTIAYFIFKVSHFHMVFGQISFEPLDCGEHSPHRLTQKNSFHHHVGPHLPESKPKKFLIWCFLKFQSKSSWDLRVDSGPSTQSMFIRSRISTQTELSWIM